jgi:hypothetical protein
MVVFLPFSLAKNKCFFLFDTEGPRPRVEAGTKRQKTWPGRDKCRLSCLPGFVIKNQTEGAAGPQADAVERLHKLYL